MKQDLMKLIENMGQIKKKNDLKGQKWRIEKPLERQEMCGVAVAMPYIFVANWK